MAAVHFIPRSPDIAHVVGRGPPCARVRVMPLGPPYQAKYIGNLSGLYLRTIPDTLRTVTWTMGGQDIFTVRAEDLRNGANVLHDVVADPPGGVLLTKDAVHHPDVLVFTYDVGDAEPVTVERRPVPFTRPLQWTDVEAYDVMLPRVEVHYDGTPARPFTLREPGPATRCTIFENPGVTDATTVLKVHCGVASLC